MMLQTDSFTHWLNFADMKYSEFLTVEEISQYGETSPLKFLSNFPGMVFAYVLGGGEGPSSWFHPRRKKMRKYLLATVAVAGIALSFPGAQAAAILIATIDGNDCSGAFGTGANCTTSGTFNGVPLNSSPIMAKFDYNNSGGISSVLTGSAFPSITGSEFNLTLGAPGFISYTYTPGVGDPLIQYVAVKGGNSFNLFAVGGSFGENNLFTPTTGNNNNRAGVSHISFYDTAVPTPPTNVPEPASLLLFGAGLLGLGLTRRARNAA